MRLDTPSGNVTVRALTALDAKTISGWRYQDPWSVYDLNDATALSAGRGFHAITAGPTNTLVGFACLGPEARVEGLTEEPGVTDGFLSAPAPP
jgi:ribosomal-protein-alanine N-acetyltransferase